MNIGWVDSHCHLTDESFLSEIEDIIKRAQDNNVVRFLCVATNLKEARTALNLKERFNLDLAVGFHPEDANDITDDDFLQLEELLKTGDFVAVGEIGLDYHWVSDNKDNQKNLFLKQMQMADRLNLPVLIHSRDASRDTFEIIKENKVKRCGVLHCYSGSIEMAREYIKLGYYISLAGPVTFKNAEVPKEVAKEIPMDRILIETDCPYMTPVPYRGQRNEPMYVKYTGMQVAELKGISDEELQRAVCLNYSSLFDKKR